MASSWISLNSSLLTKVQVTTKGKSAEMARLSQLPRPARMVW
jgi:hypothetical protein